MRGLEALEDVGQEIGADRQRGGDGDGAAAGRPQIVHGLTGQGDRAQQLLGVRPQRAPGRRQRHAGLAALEQRDSERLFQRLDARADGRLGHAEGVGGPPEAAEGAHRQERFDLGNLH